MSNISSSCLFRVSVPNLNLMIEQVNSNPEESNLHQTVDRFTYTAYPQNLLRTAAQLAQIEIAPACKTETLVVSHNNNSKDFYTGLECFQKGKLTKELRRLMLSQSIQENGAFIFQAQRLPIDKCSTSIKGIARGSDKLWKHYLPSSLQNNWVYEGQYLNRKL